jgi:hypothetical protein
MAEVVPAGKVKVRKVDQSESLPMPEGAQEKEGVHAS